MEITNYRQIDRGCVRARFDVLVPVWGLILKELTLFEKDGRKWIGLPSRQYQGRDGTAKHFQLVDFSKPIRDRFQVAVLEKIDAGQFQRAVPKEAKPAPDCAKQGMPF